MKREEKEPDAGPVKTTIRLKRSLWKAVMHRSIDENQSFQAIVEIALEQYLNRGEGRK
jgi:hypothetical protein